MEIDKAIKERRTIRHFKKKSVSWEKINEITESMIYAPSAGNLQNWKLIVVKNKGQLNKICYNQDAVVNCDFLVVVCSDNEELKRIYKDKSEFYAIQNNAAGIQNMLLKSHSLKVGSCWIGVYDELKLKALLKIPDEIDVHAVIAFGYPDEKPEIPLRADLRSIISFEEYGNSSRDSLPLIKK